MRTPLVTEALANARWSVKFVEDQFADGRCFRILNVIDDVTKESLAAVVDTSISGRRVARELTALIQWRGKPGGDYLRKRHRVHLERDPRMGREDAGEVALHRPRQTHAEWGNAKPSTARCATNS